MTVTQSHPTASLPPPTPPRKHSAATTWTIVGAVVGAIGVAVTIVLAVTGDTPKQSGCGDVTVSQVAPGGVNCTGDGESTINNHYTEINNNLSQDPSAAAETTLKELVAEYADVDPTGSGPWPFRVADDGGIGLKVRTTPYMEAIQLGGLAHLHTAWVECVVSNSGFDPDPATKNGARWLRLRWAQQTADTGLHESEPAAPGTGYSYGGYLFPVGHNGQVPECSDVPQPLTT